jgi:hypothetical protein
MRITSVRVAPKAMRTPISFVRRAINVREEAVQADCGEE